MTDATRVKVLIVDDSAMMRNVLQMGLSQDPQIEIIGSASNGEQAWEFVQHARPDVITLDLNMPKEDGMSFLRRLIPAMPIPVVVISSLTQDGTEATVAAMEAGAVDVISKPIIGPLSKPNMMAEVCYRIRSAATASPTLGRSLRAHNCTLRPRDLPQAFRSQAVIAIGASTGGVQALTRILPLFPAQSPSILLVQHMPEGFTGAFAKRLDSMTQMRVVEAQDGDAVQAGTILIAPGGARHMKLIGHGKGYRITLVEGEPVSYSRPSVDVLFHSVAKEAGRHAVAALLTGMGRDGAEGMLAMRKAGAQTYAQNEETCVVFGMPQAALHMNAASACLPLDDIPDRLLRAVSAPTAAPLRA
jgi:two-component system chemotaxis response regulator CheB